VSSSLFDQEGGVAPLAVRMRPRTVAEFVGQGHALNQGGPLQRLLSENKSEVKTSVILWGPPGTGKTTLAQLMARAGNAKFVELSAVTAGVKDVREVIAAADQNRSLYGAQTVLFVDEVHRFNRAQQDALLPGVESGSVTLVAATTENPSFSVIAPLLSRSLLVTLTSLSDENVESLITRALTDPRGLDKKVAIENDALNALVRLAGGDARRALTILEAASAVCLAQNATAITLEHLETASDHAVIRYDRAGDQHYDVVSAFIKSVRGSDVDAALHYLARMIEAGEDPRFIARRLMILASEDIGLAHPTALQTAVAAAQTVALIGFPEARITLAQATIELSLAPKSNSAYLAIDAAIADLRSGNIGEVPAHLRDSHYARAGDLGHGVGYLYPHDVIQGVASQPYLPEVLADSRYYVPVERGHEVTLAKVWEKVRGLLGRK